MWGDEAIVLPQGRSNVVPALSPLRWCAFCWRGACEAAAPAGLSGFGRFRFLVGLDSVSFRGLRSFWSFYWPLYVFFSLMLVFGGVSYLALQAPVSTHFANRRTPPSAMGRPIYPYFYVFKTQKSAPVVNQTSNFLHQGTLQ